MNTLLIEFLAHETDARPAPEIAACAAYLQSHFGPATAAVLFYGSGLRATAADAPLDFYVLVDDLRSTIRKPLSRLAAFLLPPNVYAIDVPRHDGTRACKVAVMTTAAFVDAMHAFAPHLWARFAQPITIAFARDLYARATVCAARATAIETAIARSQPLMDGTFTAEKLWLRIFAESYAAELRPESQADRAAELVAARAPYYRDVTRLALGAPPIGDVYAAQRNGRSDIAWALCRRWGKALNFLRLMKAAFTYAGGLDYAVAKIARHSGVRVAVTDADRRWPLLGGLRIFLEARRKGGVR
jgi:hypothetical protein